MDSDENKADAGAQAAAVTKRATELVAALEVTLRQLATQAARAEANRLPKAARQQVVKGHVRRAREALAAARAYVEATPEVRDAMPALSTELEKKEKTIEDYAQAIGVKA